MTVLVVEDEKELVLILKSSLEAAGYSPVETAENGQEAYNKCIAAIKEKKKIDLVISDWDMPVMNGIQLLKKIRENALLSDVPFILITGVGTEETVKLASQCGASAVLLKPFQNETLLEKVKAHLSPAPQRGSA